MRFKDMLEIYLLKITEHPKASKKDIFFATMLTRFYTSNSRPNLGYITPFFTDKITTNWEYEI